MPLRLVRKAPSAPPPPREKPAGFEGVLGRAGLHEIFGGRDVDAAAATCFVLGTLRPKKLLWARHELVRIETGDVYPPGLLSLGIDPAAVTLVRLRDPQLVLQAGLEAARCNGLSAAVVELWGEAKAYNLTASRKLLLAAKKANVTLCILRHAAEPDATAAETRWLVRRLSSQPLAANAPGWPRLEVTLLKNRGGKTDESWCVEWNEHEHKFENRSVSPIYSGLAAAPLFKSVVPLSGFRKIPLRKTG